MLWKKLAQRLSAWKSKRVWSWCPWVRWVVVAQPGSLAQVSHPGTTKVLSGAALLLRMVPCRFTQRGIGRVGSHRLLAGDVPQSLDGWSLLWGSLRPHGEFIWQNRRGQEEWNQDVCSPGRGSARAWIPGDGVPGAILEAACHTDCIAFNIYSCPRDMILLCHWGHQPRGLSALPGPGAHPDNFSPIAFCFLQLCYGHRGCTRRHPSHPGLGSTVSAEEPPTSTTRIKGRQCLLPPGRAV